MSYLKKNYVVYIVHVKNETPPLCFVRLLDITIFSFFGFEPTNVVTLNLRSSVEKYYGTPCFVTQFYKFLNFGIGLFANPLNYPFRA